MQVSRWIRISLLIALPLAMFGVVGCDDDNDVTGSGGALASLNLDVPETVTANQAFEVHLTATAIGVQNVQNGVVTITFPSAIQVTSVDAEAGTTASVSGNTITWTLNTLDSNTNSTLNIHSMGTLPAGSTNQNLTVQASMVADGIGAGELTASENFTLQP